MKRYSLIVIILGLIALTPALARIVDGLTAPGPKQQIGPLTHYSAATIQAAVAAAPGYNAQVMSQAGNLAVNMESGGNQGIWNGTCCTGLLQMNVTNLTKYGYTPHTYAVTTLQNQVNAWVSLTASSMNTPAVRALSGMSTFDGQPVDSALLLACIQLGPGNCQKMVSKGQCNGFSDINGTSICKMAQAIRGKAGAGSTSAPAATNAQGTSKTGGNGSSGNLAQANPPPTICTPSMVDTEIAAGLDIQINQPAAQGGTTP